MVAETLKPEAPPTFREHQEALEQFVDYCNYLLRELGLRYCEATVTATWGGKAVLTRNYATDRRHNDGEPWIIGAQAMLPLPWTEKTKLSPQELIEAALKGIEQEIRVTCVRQGIMRVSFDELARRTSKLLVEN